MATPTVTKKDLIDTVTNKLGMTKTDAEIVFDAFLNAIKDGLAAHANVRVSGIGVLKVTQSSARVCRNPQTGAAVNVPSKYKAQFSPSQELDKLVNRTDVPASAE